MLTSDHLEFFKALGIEPIARVVEAVADKAAQTAGAAADKAKGAAVGAAEGVAGKARELAEHELQSLKKAREVWVATRRHIDGELAKFTAAIKDSYQGHPALAKIEKKVAERLETLLDKLDASLAEKLDELQTTAVENQPRLIKEAKALLKACESHIANDKMVSALDSNPFVPISVHKTISATVAAINRSLG